MSTLFCSLGPDGIFRPVGPPVAFVVIRGVLALSNLSMAAEDAASAIRAFGNHVWQSRSFEE